MADNIKIQAIKEGFRRLGIAHTIEPVIYPEAHFTPQQVVRLMADQWLVVAITADEPSPGAEHAVVIDAPLPDVPESQGPLLFPLLVELVKAADPESIDQALSQAAMSYLDDNAITLIDAAADVGQGINENVVDPETPETLEAPQPQRATRRRAKIKAGGKA